MTLQLVPWPQMVAVSAAVPLAAGVAVSPEHVQLVVILAATVASVAGAIAWIDGRIERGRKVNAEAIAALGQRIEHIAEAVQDIRSEGCARACHDPEHRRHK